ncbi:MAG: RHS repeat domain-containing protein, partial [Kangiellaceae bacterium]
TQSKNAASGYIYQEITDMNARMQLTEARKANGILIERLAYTYETGQMESIETDTAVGGNQRHRINYEYDDFGNLLKQTVENLDSDLNIITSIEDYVYDDLHRLTDSIQTIDQFAVAGNTINSTISYSYDAVGNILSKDDYGHGFVYGDINRATRNAGPNAVLSVNKNTGGTAEYTYDNNGNMTDGDGKTLTYNAFNKPLTITKNSVASTFSYGSSQMRYKQVKTGLPDGTETTIYIGKAYEEITKDGVTKKRSYLGDAILTETIGGNDAGFKIGFVHRDRLNSTVTITNHEGNVVDNKSFDPFGKPREGTFKRIDSDSIVIPTTLDLIRAQKGYEEHTNRGFTDHEHLDDAELIHMNGRVYDYNLGRFLSVDPFIQSPGNSQSMNPYSYIMNNPLAGVDPSGYCSAQTGTRIKKCTDVEVKDDSTGETIATKSVNVKHSNVVSHIASFANGALKGGTVTGISSVEKGKTTDILSPASTNGNGTGGVGTNVNSNSLDADELIENSVATSVGAAGVIAKDAKELQKSGWVQNGDRVHKQKFQGNQHPISNKKTVVKAKKSQLRKASSAKALGVAGGVLSLYAIIDDSMEFSNGDISIARYGFRMTGNFLPLAIAASSAPLAFTVGAGFVGVEMFYDSMLPTIDNVNRQIKRDIQSPSDFSNFFTNGFTRLYENLGEYGQ